MDPITLIALVSAVGFIFRSFKKNDNQSTINSNRSSYCKTTVANSEDKSQDKAIDKQINILPEYILAKKLVESQFPIVFVTGGAGTGKSTFIEWLYKEFEGSVLLAAPTGLAAINIGGKTLHSLCNFPPVFLLQKDIKLTPRKQEIREAKLLIIDEISMVTSNLLDGVSAYFRKNRGGDQPFGGLSVIIVGDLFQLPPIVIKQTRESFERNYETPKFYHARSLEESPLYAIELQQTFRQTNQEFVDLLAKIREGVDIDQCLSILNERCEITNNPPTGAVWLSPRNAEVDQKNMIELKKIQGNSKIYNGRISGKFKSDRLPSPDRLEIRDGAQVMFTKNGRDQEKKWTNGFTGRVMKMTEDYIEVLVTKTHEKVKVEREKWSDYEYFWDEDKKEIQREEIGYFEQFPLTLGWAMTIHKSQGLTLERVHLELGAGAFESGQTYVALSRCRSIDRLTLSRPLTRKDIKIDHDVVDFYYKTRKMIEQVSPEKMLMEIEKLNETS